MRIDDERYFLNSVNCIQILLEKLGVLTFLNAFAEFFLKNLQNHLIFFGEYGINGFE